MKGYKGFNADMTCRGMQYEVGKTYEMDEMEGKPKLCARGYHYCETLAQCFEYYDPQAGAVFCEIQADGETVTDGSKCATNRISIGVAIAPVEVWRAFYGYGNGYGNGDGNGYGNGDGNGNGYGYGYGNGNGYGDGYGNGDGNGNRNIQKILTFKED